MAEESELTVDQKREAEDFIDSVIVAIQSSTLFMQMVSAQLDMIGQRLDRIEFALMDESKAGRA